jgi:hypothetical protein
MSNYRPHLSPDSITNNPPAHRPIKRIRARQAEERCLVDDEFWPCSFVQAQPARPADAALRAILAHQPDSDDPNQACPVCTYVIDSRDHEDSDCIVAAALAAQPTPAQDGGA